MAAASRCMPLVRGPWQQRQDGGSADTDSGLLASASLPLPASPASFAMRLPPHCTTPPPAVCTSCATRSRCSRRRGGTSYPNRERLRPERPFDTAQGRPELAEGQGAKPPSESERGWGPASAEKRLRPERGAKPPSESEREWGPASAEKRLRPERGAKPPSESERVGPRER